MADTGKKIISLPLKDFIGLCLFIISLGISIGGFIKVLNDFDKLDSKIDKISEAVASVKEQNAEFKGILSQLPQKK